MIEITKKVEGNFGNKAQKFTFTVSLYDEYNQPIKGKKYVILGNHDTNPRVECYRNSPDTEILGYAIPFKYGKYHFYLSHYPSLTANYDQDDPLPMRVINLCGHTHTPDRFSDMDKGLIYHVELDAHDNKPVSIEKIIEEVARTYGVSPEDIRSVKNRRANLSNARHVAIYIVRQVTGLSMTAIGEEFGGRHYSTIVYTNQEMEKKLEKDIRLKETVEDIIKNIQDM